MENKLIKHNGYWSYNDVTITLDNGMYKFLCPLTGQEVYNYSLATTIKNIDWHLDPSNVIPIVNDEF